MPEKVLVVEDDVEINELLGEYLNLEGIEYVAAFDGTSALKTGLPSHPDAIILDLMLPDIDGYEICRRVVGHRATADIPVIMLTCLNQDCDRQKGLATGAFRYMNKPFLPDDLIAALKEAFVWKSTLATRPPVGQVEISSENPQASLHGINEMLADLSTRSRLSDSALRQIRDGFLLLRDWALAWGRQTQKDPQLQIAYRLTAGSNGDLAGPHPADFIDWTISERAPALLAELLFKPQPMPTTPSRNNSVTDANSRPSPLAAWFGFLAKSGVARFEKDSATGQIRLARPLAAPRTGPAQPAVPIVTIDGTRVPTRIREEALTNKRK